MTTPAPAPIRPNRYKAEPSALTALRTPRILTREVLADLDTPLSTYLKLADAPWTFLLESVQGGERWGRYSIIGLPCAERIRVRGRSLVHERDEVFVPVVDRDLGSRQFRLGFFHRGGCLEDIRLPQADIFLDSFGVQPYQLISWLDDRAAFDHPGDGIGTAHLALDFRVVRAFQRPLLGNTHQQVPTLNGVRQPLLRAFRGDRTRDQYRCRRQHTGDHDQKQPALPPSSRRGILPLASSARAIFIWQHVC